MRLRPWPLLAALCLLLAMAGCDRRIIPKELIGEAGSPPAPETGALALGDFDARQLVNTDWLVRFTDRSQGADVRFVRLRVMWDGREVFRGAFAVRGDGTEAVVWEEQRDRFDVTGSGATDPDWEAFQQLLDSRQQPILDEEVRYELEINS